MIEESEREQQACKYIKLFNNPYSIQPPEVKPPVLTGNLLCVSRPEIGHYTKKYRAAIKYVLPWVKTECQSPRQHKDEWCATHKVVTMVTYAPESETA